MSWNLCRHTSVLSICTLFLPYLLTLDCSLSACWYGLWDWMELLVLIITDDFEGPIINPVTVKDYDAVQAQRKPTYPAHQTPLGSPSTCSSPFVDGMKCESSLVIGRPAWTMTISTSLLILCTSGVCVLQCSGGVCFPTWRVVILVQHLKTMFAV